MSERSVGKQEGEGRGTKRARAEENDEKKGGVDARLGKGAKRLAGREAVHVF